MTVPTAALLVAAVIGSVTTRANAVTGSVSGFVTDAGGAPLSGISVAAYDATGGNAQFVSTDASGAFAFPNLAAGTYYIRTHASALGGQNYIDEVFNNITCWGCAVTSGTPIGVTTGSVTTGVNFALATGGQISGTVTDAVNGAPLAGILVWTYNDTGTFATLTFTNGAGVYSVGGLPTGSYRVRAVGTQTHVGELYFNLLCSLSCDVTVGAPVQVTAAVQTNGIDLSLDRAGAISGTVTDAGNSAPLAGVTVGVYSAAGALFLNTVTSGTGAFTAGGLPAGTYYARTSNTSGYRDEIFNDLALCAPSCKPTSGTSIPVTAGATTSGIDFALVVGGELIRNGDFSSGTSFWSLFATPDPSYIVSQVVSEVFQYYRVPPPSGTSNQAVILQGTGAALPLNAPLLAQFDFGNSSPLRRRISVLIHEGDFSDLSVCTFWLEPNTPRTRYGMRTHTTTAWTNATISFYAASADATGAFYEIDNVSMQVAPVADTRTDCIDPTTPNAPGGIVGPELLTNPDFSAGLNAWTLFGQLVSQVNNAAFEFYRPPPATNPAGVILQFINSALPKRDILTAQFDLGNSSPVRKRVTVLLHDLDFSDLTACTFWLAPGQALSTYVMRGFATESWTSPTISVYAATVGTEQWTQLDNVSLRRTPGQAVIGTECIEPGGTLGAPAPEAQDLPVADFDAVDIATSAAPNASAGERYTRQRRPQASEEPRL